MLNKNTNRSIAPFIIFLISPILSLPFTLYDVYRRKKGALFNLALFTGVLTYLLLPDWSLDIARYYYGYNEMQYYSFSDFLNYLDTRTDYIFYFLFFLFNKLGLKFQIFLFVVSTFNFYVFFKFYEVFFGNKLKNKKYFTNFILYFLSVSILYYLSGTRYVLACSFLLISLFDFYVYKRKFRGYIFFIFALMTHIGVLVYLPFLFFIHRIKNKKLLIQISSIVFVAFATLPVQNILFFISTFLPGFSNKALIYVNETRDTNWSLLVSYFLTLIIGLVFLIKYYSKLPLMLLHLFLTTLLPVIITLPFGFLVYDRYIMNFKPMLVICIIYIIANERGLKDNFNLFLFKKGLLLAFSLYFVYSIYLYRHNIAPYFQLDNLFFYSILQKTYTLKDIFYI